MSKSTYHVETVHSSTYDSGGMVASNSTSSYFHHVPVSAFQPALSLQIHPSYQSAATPQPLLRQTPARATPHPPLPRSVPTRTCQPQLIATISAGFEKGDYLIREERGSNIYFDFFEEAYNFACQNGYARMPKHEEMEYMEIIKHAHRSVPGGCRFNTGRLLMVLRKKLVPIKIPLEEEKNEEPSLGQSPVGADEGGGSLSHGSTRSSGSSSSSQRKKKRKDRKKLALSTNTEPTDSESYSVPSSAYSGSASTSYVDSWE